MLRNISTTLKITAFWYTVPCSFIGLMEAVHTSETSVYFLYVNETTQSHMPEGCNIPTRRRKNITCHIPQW
jgi:hypothetical protein